MNSEAPRYRVILIRVVLLALLTALTWGILVFLGSNTTFLYSLRGMYGSVPPVGTLLDPHHGLWYTARNADHHDGDLNIAALKEDVNVIRDARGVPHIFARNDRDAVIATGYVVAQDRLFQLDFIPRAAAGRLSEVFGPDLVDTDRYLRSTGMEWGAQINMDSIRAENGIENDLINWFAAGVNARIDELAEYELPIEFRLLGYRPDRYEPINTIRLLQFMAFDLSFNTDDSNYGELRYMMNEDEYDELYPRQSFLYEPIIPAGEGSTRSRSPVTPVESNGAEFPPDSAVGWLRGPIGIEAPKVPGAFADLPLPGFKPGKGSNNWAVTRSKSETGGALLAGDMHLDLTLPAIWYELHIVTPTMNTRGVLIPGAPLPIEAFNDRLGWTFTNTGADQVDHYSLVVDSSRTAYRFNEKWLPFEVTVDTIHSRWTGVVPDTVRFTRFGPVMGWPSEPVAVQWTAHKRAKTLRALWNMHRAQDVGSFQHALRFWDSPMQNILYADVEGNIAIRSTGRLPIRRAGHGAGLLDGTTDAFDWTGRVPFEELPYAENPSQDFLASANQQPADDSYPYYLGHNWYRSYRSLRINELLRSKPRHGLGDMKTYQADIHVVQRDLFVPMLDTLSGLSEDASFLRHLLVSWNGNADIEAAGPLVLDEYLRNLQKLTWDEFASEDLRLPRQVQLYRLLTEEPKSRWLDIRATDLKKEEANDILRLALEATADTMRSRYGWDEETWRWDRHHSLLIRHLTKSNALAALGVGPLSYPGFANTLSPAPGRITTNGASWRMVVDFSTNPPSGYGVYPGGQSGNPFSRHYVDQIPLFVHFGYYRLSRPSDPDGLVARDVSAKFTLSPINPPSEGDQQPDERSK